jgi:hypothetical protein
MPQREAQMGVFQVEIGTAEFSQMSISTHRRSCGRWGEEQASLRIIETL